jgi:hypothetical protein
LAVVCHLGVVDCFDIDFHCLDTAVRLAGGSLHLEIGCRSLVLDVVRNGDQLVAD